MKILNKILMKQLIMMDFFNLNCMVKNLNHNIDKNVHDDNLKYDVLKDAYYQLSCEEIKKELVLNLFYQESNLVFMPNMLKLPFLMNQLHKEYSNNKKQLEKIINSWNNCVSLLRNAKNIVEINKRLTTIKEYSLNKRNIEKEILFILIEDDMPLNIWDNCFWNNVENKRKFTKSEIKKYIKILVNIFDHNDIVNFSMLLKEKYKENNQNDIRLALYKGLLKKYINHHSLSSIPHLLITKLAYSKKEENKLETLKMLRYFKYEESKIFFINEFEQTSREKIIVLCKEILEKNNYFLNNKRSNMMLEDNDSIIYVKSIKIDTLYLREKVKDNKLLTQTLIALALNQIKTKYRINVYHSEILKIELHTANKDDLEVFKQYIEQVFNFSFGHYISEEKYQMLSKTRNGSRIYHEQNDKIKDDYLNQLNAFILKENLDKSLTLKKETQLLRKL